MAGLDSKQPLIAAFVFGIIAAGAFAALPFVAKFNNRQPVLQHSLRLVLITFLASAGLWATLDFISMTIDSSTACQVTVIFGSGFDQLARVAYEQFLLWGLGGGFNVSTGLFVQQGAILLRFVLGGVYLGFQRSDFNPVCITSTSILPLAITILSFDGVIITSLLLRATLSIKSTDNSTSQVDQKRHRMMLWGCTAAGIWTALSVPMILGITSLALILRTLLPAIGIVSVIIIAIIFQSHLSSHDDQSPKTAPEDYQFREHRIRGFVSPQNTRKSFLEWPPTYTADVKRAQSTARVSTTNPPNVNKALPKIAAAQPGQSEFGIGGLPVTGQLVPPLRPEPFTHDSWPQLAEETQHGRHLYQKGSQKHKKGQRLIISAPVLTMESVNPLDRVATVDLETAARNDKRRRDMHPQPLRSHSLSSRDPQTDTTMRRSKSMNARKALPNSTHLAAPRTHLEPITESTVASMTSSAQPSPGAEEMRRRSPLQLQRPFARESAPPLPPLKTPGTVTSLGSLAPRQPQPDAWDLLSVPQSDSKPPPVYPPPRSPRRPRPSTSPGIDTYKTMPPSRDIRVPKPIAPPRTDTKPPIPDKCVGRVVPDQNTRSDGPPFYRPDAVKFSSPRRATIASPTPQNPTSPAYGFHSPSRPDMKLSIFPPAYTSRAIGATTLAKASSFTMNNKTKALPRTISSRQTSSDKVPHIARHVDRGRQDFADQTVMSLGAVEYDRPIKTQIVEAPFDKPLPSSSNIDVPMRESILNRPRPVPRTPETARLLLMHGGSQRQPHRRSRSCSVIPTEKSIRHTPTLGSPSPLPPVPPIPQDDDSSSQRLPNDTKSMTFEEKMDLFYPMPKSSKSSTSRSTRRRSRSLPDVPLQQDFLNTPPLPPRVISDHKGENLRSFSTKASMRSQSVLGLNNPAGKSDNSPDAANGATATDGEADCRTSERTESRKSSSGLDVRSRSAPTSPESSAGDPFQDPGQGSRDDEPREDLRSTPSSEDAFEFDEPSEIEDFDAEAQISSPGGNHESYRSASEGVQTVSRGMAKHNPWHQRLGHPCPSFTNRESPMYPRRGPPPTPLLLNNPRKAVIVQAEPSPAESPLQSHEHALDMIEEQLQKLERSSRTSSVAEEQRAVLLADLEMEMGLQENRWQSLRHTVFRNSSSTINMSPAPAVPADGRYSSLWLKNNHLRECMPAAELSRSFNVAGSSTSVAKKASTLEANIRNSFTRLGNPTNRMSLLSVSHPSTGHLGSPTPPDSDESDEGDEADIPIIYTEDYAFMFETPKAPALWHVGIPSPLMLKHAPSLWSPTSTSFVVPKELPNLRPTTAQDRAQRNLCPLSIQSTALWTPPKKLYKPDSRGLWGPASSIKSESPPTRPKLAQKPVRKSRRMTILPDILESPKPLPDKRGTLGIFQFPWGETSDTGIYQQPRYNALPMPGTMTTGRQSAIIPVYPSVLPDFQSNYEQPSFFDDCDEEDYGDNFSNSGSDEEDDDFDETTLWEIASLLQPDKGQSNRQSVTLREWKQMGQRRSVVASPTESVESSYEDYLPMVLEVKTPEPLQVKTASLWRNKSEVLQGDKVKGLPSPGEQKWKPYLNAVTGSIRASKRFDTQSAITSAELWNLPSTRDVASNTALWHWKIESPLPTVKQDSSHIAKLWAASQPTPRKHTYCLWSPSEPMRNDTESHMELPGPEIRPGHRNLHRQSLKLTSETLWLRDATEVPSSPNWLMRSMPHATPTLSSWNSPTISLERPIVTEEEWDAALQEAINSGRNRRVEELPGPACITPDDKPLLTTSKGPCSPLNGNIQPSQKSLWIRKLSTNPPLGIKSVLWTPAATQNVSFQETASNGGLLPRQGFLSRSASIDSPCTRDFNDQTMWRGTGTGT